LANVLFNLVTLETQMFSKPLSSQCY